MRAIYLGFFKLNNLNGNWIITSNLEIGLLKNNEKIELTDSIFNINKEHFFLYSLKNVRNKTEIKLFAEKYIDKIIKLLEPTIISFINNSTQLTIKQHQLNLIKGLGPKTIEKILKERNITLFKNFEDLEARISKNIIILFKQIILKELSTNFSILNYILR